MALSHFRPSAAWLRWIALAVVVVWGAAPVGVAAIERSGAAAAVDGDTIDIDGERIRLAGIDAPESKQTCVVNGFGWACGGEATRSLSAMLDSGPVRCEGNKRDRYDRLIATCWAGARSVNAEMVRGGWALAYRKYSLAYVEEEAEARAAGRGVWRGQFVEPWEHRQSQRLAQADRSHEQR